MPGFGTARNTGIEGEGVIRDDYYMFDLNNWLDEGKGKQFMNSVGLNCVTLRH